LIWQGQAFRFERITSRTQPPPECVWAVHRRGEFIGTMNCSTEVTTREFDRRCTQWLGELFSPAP
jgi:hypothetical protein